MNKVYCCYPGGKHKALTMSYDDGRSYDRKLIEIFNQYGINSSLVGVLRRLSCVSASKHSAHSNHAYHQIKKLLHF